MSPAPGNQNTVLYPAWGAPEAVPNSYDNFGNSSFAQPGYGGGNVVQGPWHTPGAGTETVGFGSSSWGQSSPNVGFSTPGFSNAAPSFSTPSWEQPNQSKGFVSPTEYAWPTPNGAASGFSGGYNNYGNTSPSGYGTGNVVPIYAPIAASAGGRSRLGNALTGAKESLGRLFNRNESVHRGAPQVGSTALRGIMGKAANVFRTKTVEARAAWTPERQERAGRVARKAGKIALGAAVQFGNEFGQHYGISVDERGLPKIDSKSTLVKEGLKLAFSKKGKAEAAVHATRAARNAVGGVAAQNRYTQAAFAGTKGGWRGVARGVASEARQHGQQYVQEQGGVGNVVSMAARRAGIPNMPFPEQRRAA